MTYYLIPHTRKKNRYNKRLEKKGWKNQQGYDKDEYDIIMQTDDILKVSDV